MRRRAASRWYRFRSQPPLLSGSRPSAPPDFVGVGAQRSGTTWWHGLIDSHPRVHSLGWPFKELHFFDRFADTDFTSADVRQYHEFFRHPATKFCGEWTPRYMFDASTPSLLRRAAPDAKLLVMLRNPVDRFESGFNHALANGVARDEAWDEAFRRGLYHEQLVRLLDHFPREQILVLQFERCRAERDAMLDRTFEFLGLDRWHPPSRRDRQNAGRRLPESAVTETERTELGQRYHHDVTELAARFPEIELRFWTQ